METVVMIKSGHSSVCVLVSSQDSELLGVACSSKGDCCSGACSRGLEECAEDEAWGDVRQTESYAEHVVGVFSKGLSLITPLGIVQHVDVEVSRGLRVGVGVSAKTNSHCGTGGGHGSHVTSTMSALRRPTYGASMTSQKAWMSHRDHVS